MKGLGENFFKGRLWVFYRNVFCAVDKLLTPAIINTGLSLTQARILFSICEAGEISVGELSEQSKMNPGNCSTMCKNLERDGYVNRFRSREDERIVRLSLTEKGKNICGDILRESDRIHNAILENFSEAERKKIIKDLDKIEHFFKRLSDSADCEKEMKKDGNE